MYETKEPPQNPKRENRQPRPPRVPHKPLITSHISSKLILPKLNPLSCRLFTDLAEHPQHSLPRNHRTQAELLVIWPD